MYVLSMAEISQEIYWQQSVYPYCNIKLHLWTTYSPAQRWKDELVDGCGVIIEAVISSEAISEPCIS